MGGLMITESRALQTLRDIVVSGRPLVWVRTTEESRLLGLLRVLGEQCFPKPVPVWTWSLTEGLHRDGEPAEATPRSPRATLDAIAASAEPGVFLLRDFHEPMRDAADVRRRFRDLYEACRGRDIVVVVSAPGVLVSEELARAVVSIELGLPDLPELRGFLDMRVAALKAKGVSVDDTPATLDQLARALQGLTVDEAGHALQRALVERGALDANAVPSVLEEKRLLVNRTGMIEFVNTETRFDQLGGMSLMKQWLVERTKLFRMREEIDREIVPKGVLVMGVSGCGKSLAIKAIASAFELPLYRIDMIEVFSGRHGRPEGAFAAACNMLTALAPAVVWFDEIEAAITANAKESDLGRIFGFFLTWMQEKPRGLFVGATANRIDLLPAEMIRKGRFDEVFFVDLPGDDERLEIFRVHLGRRNVDSSGFNLEPLKKITRGWTGAEIEQCVVSAMTRARLADRAVTADDLFNATNGVVPLSKTMKEQVDHIRNWAFDRAVRASPRDMTVGR
jgi:SpoVK/Ycf46/Vps4 family AAA+-type ATPase